MWRNAVQDPRAPQASRPLLDDVDAAALIARARGARVARFARPVGQRAPGDSASAWMGRGLDYAESRAYQAGDDLRDLHWRLLARTGRPYVKVHREEHAPAWHALLDLRPGMAFGTHLRTKAEQAARMALLDCAAQALAAEGAAGRMGITLWQHPPRAIDLGRGLPAVRRLAQVLGQERVIPACASGMARGQPEDATALFANWAQRLARTLPEGARVLLASDGAGWDAPDIDAALWALRSRAEVVLLRVTDPVEADLPDDALLDGAVFVDLARHQSGALSAAARAAFARRAAQRREAMLARWRTRGLRCIDAGVDRDDAAVLRALRVAGA